MIYITQLTKVQSSRLEYYYKLTLKEQTFFPYVINPQIYFDIASMTNPFSSWTNKEIFINALSKI